MSVVSPWGFGINRAEIQQLVRELVVLATGLPPESVFLTDAAARGPQPPRSWASIQLGAPVAVQQTGNCERIWQAKEQWTVTIDSVVLASNPQRLTILGTDYDFTAVVTSTLITRDGLLASIGFPTEFSAFSQETNQILIQSNIDGQRLQVQKGAGNDFTIVQDQGNAFIRNLRPFELQCNITCNGFMDIEAPETTQSGQSLADLVEMTMSSRDMTEKMRDCGHVPVRTSRLFDAGPLNRQQLNQSTLQVVIATTGRLDINITSVTQAPMEPTATQ